MGIERASMFKMKHTCIYFKSADQERSLLLKQKLLHCKSILWQTLIVDKTDDPQRFDEVVEVAVLSFID